MKCAPAVFALLTLSIPTLAAAQTTPGAVAAPTSSCDSPKRFIGVCPQMDTHIQIGPTGRELLPEAKEEEIGLGSGKVRLPRFRAHPGQIIRVSVAVAGGGLEIIRLASKINDEAEQSGK